LFFERRKKVKEKIAGQKKAAEEAENKFEQEKKKLNEMIAEHQKLCLHNNTEKIFIRMENRLDKLEVLRGHRCKDCDKFIPSKVYDKYLPRLSQYCARCDGEVEFEGCTGSKYDCDVEHWYKCKVCGCKQKEFVG